MEVFIRHVPPQSGNYQLRKELRPHLERLSIRGVDYKNPYGRDRAFLTFLHAEDGKRFLDHHGQNPREPGARRSTRIRNDLYKQLYCLGQPIYCEKAKDDPSPVVLRGLAREEKEGQAGKDLKKPKQSSHLPMDFNTSSVACGTFAYRGSELVFVPQYRLEITGHAKFGTRSMILTLDSGIRIDFVYSAVESITTELEPRPSFIFSMHENPRLFERIGDPVGEVAVTLGLADLLDLLSISGIQQRKGPERNRISDLGPEHRPIAGHCFVYRIEVVATITIGHGLFDDTSTMMYKLEKSPETPAMIQYRTRVVPPIRSYAEEFKDLHRALNSLNSPLPFELAFQMQRLAQNNYLPPSAVLALFEPVVDILNRSGSAISVAVLRRLFNQIAFPSPFVDSHDFEVTSLVERLRENEDYIVKTYSVAMPIYDKVSKNTAVIHRARVTPMGIYLSGPEAESNNRILRKYPNHHNFFLRVQFCDENGDQINFNQKVSRYKILHVRFQGIMENGITIAGRTFEFLGFSHSSLRMQSCWFVAPFIHEGGLLTDRDIIRDLGDFTLIKSPAKCAARIGQAFSDTRTAVPIDPEAVAKIPDIECGKYVFSDGVGTLSLSLLENIVSELPRALHTFPTCLQIRYKGAKGMVSLDSRLQGDILRLRDSMVKFDGSSSNDIEICDATYKPLPVYLNRQFIKIMEDMGVRDSFFMDLQNKEIEKLRLITESPVNASTFLRKQSIGEHFNFHGLITGLAMLNLDFKSDGFLSNILEVAFLSELRMLKHKTRIPVPKGWHLHGVMDETGLLEEGEIFCVVIVDGVRSVISGDQLLITRAPALHPGDIQLAKGIIPPKDSPLMQLANCVCFSQKGKRDLPSKLGGGDLDGDRYYVIWDDRALPKQTFEPAEYPRKEPINIGRVVRRSDMTNFFIDFMDSDQLGRIAVGHRVLADQREAGTLDSDCITSAELHSDAVDFSKTGIPPDMSLMPRYPPWRPDFEAPGPHVEIHRLQGVSFQAVNWIDPNEVEQDEDDDFTTYRYYESDRIIGRLYRAIDERSIFEEIQQRAMKIGTTSTSTVINSFWKHVQDACKLIQWEHLKEDARGIRDMYETCLLNIMKDYSSHPHRPLSELEVFAGTILGKDGAPNRHQRELSISMKEKFDSDTQFILDCIIKTAPQNKNLAAEDEREWVAGSGNWEWSNQSLEMSMACLAVSLEDSTAVNGEGKKEGIGGEGEQHILSFKYLAAAVCLREVERLAVPMTNGVQLLQG